MRLTTFVFFPIHTNCSYHDKTILTHAEDAEFCCTKGMKNAIEKKISHESFICDLIVCQIRRNSQCFFLITDSLITVHLVNEDVDTHWFVHKKQHYTPQNQHSPFKRKPEDYFRFVVTCSKKKIFFVSL